MTDELAFLDAVDQRELVTKGEMTTLELVDAAISRAESLNQELNAIIHPRYEKARAEAASATGPFAGVPIVLKDLDGALAGESCHLGNKLLKEINYVDTDDDYLFAKLRAAGFIPIGKTNTPEFGLMPTTEPEAYGPSRNPWNTAYSTGGSSGGTAGAVASGIVPLGHAGDGGGSIRIPASACGLFGLKPSRGRISMGPELGEAWGGLVVRHVLTRSVRDSAAVLDLLAGPMPGDPYTAPPPARPYARELGVDPGRLRIGLRTHAPSALAETDPECVAAGEDAARLLESLGHSVEIASPAALEETSLMSDFTALLSTGVVSEIEHLAELVGREIGPDDVEPLTWAQYEMGRNYSSGDYLRAITSAHAWTRRVIQWFTAEMDGGQGFDLLLTPTMAEPPALLGDLVGTADDPWRALGRATPFAAYTAPFNVTGQPAISVPLYWEASRNLPIGVQLVANQYREDLLIQVASQLETARPWADRRPPVHA